MTRPLLLEIGTEELPASFIAPALAAMADHLTGALADAGVDHGQVTTMGTPRRLTVCVEAVARRQPDRREEVVGPPVQVAFDGDGNPTKAALGFARSQGIDLAATTRVTTPRGEYLAAVLERPGRATEELLTEILPQLVTRIPFAKSMRWGTGTVPFGRPIQWFAALFGDTVIPFAINDIPSGDTSRGHRFMAPEPFRLATADCAAYRQALKERHVIVDPVHRRQLLAQRLAETAAAAGGRLVADEELLDIVTNLVEEPHPLRGTFEERFLALPREVLITSMREHQKYFALEDEAGKLLPAFIAVNNTRVRDEALGAEGHQRVIRARLEDALFFFTEDGKTPLAQRVDDLEGLIFQQRLGSMREKSQRISELAGWLARRLAPAAEETARRAGLLAKADLLTEMVSEFPSLQGVMGREYARRDGEEEAVAVAIHEHYLPVRAGGQLPATDAGCLVALADRLDTLVGCFGIGQIPSGTADPFGLRRLTLGLLHILEARQWRLSLRQCISEAFAAYAGRLDHPLDTTVETLSAFIRGRFANDLTARSVAPETVEAAVSVGFDDPVDCYQRVTALHAMSNRPEFGLLAGAFKRASNILKGSLDHEPDPHLFQTEAEEELWRTLAEVTETCRPLLAAGAYQEALEAMLAMKPAVDRFFDDVMVMVEDPALRASRLGLLAATARLFRQVGDFSKMYGLGKGGGGETAGS